jgi:hypothetical protein
VADFFQLNGASLCLTELPIPSGYNRASDWMSWTQINTAAYMLGLTKNFDVGEKFAISDRFKTMIANGSVQKWRRGHHAYYRMIWK